MRQAAIITEQHDNDVWGERSVSTSVIGVLVQHDSEADEAFIARVKAKVEALTSETVRGRRKHYGVQSSTHPVLEAEGV